MTNNEEELDENKNQVEAIFERGFSIRESKGGHITYETNGYGIQAIEAIKQQVLEAINRAKIAELKVLGARLNGRAAKFAKDIEDITPDQVAKVRAKVNGTIDKRIQQLNSREEKS